MNTKLVLLAFIFSMVFVSGIVSATDFQCDTCASCNTAIGSAVAGNDTVILNTSITTGSNCVLVNKNITFSCQGNEINLGGAGVYGISVSGSGATITDCVVSGSSTTNGAVQVGTTYATIMNTNVSYSVIGVRVNTGSYLMMLNDTLLGNSNSGVYYSYTGALPSTIQDSIFDSNNAGLYTPARVTVDNCNFTGNTHAGIILYGSTYNNNIIRNSYFTDNLMGIKLQSPSASINNTIYNNFFNSTTNVEVDVSAANVFNVSLQSGTSIVGGHYIGGNYYGGIDGANYSDTCTDSEGDGICDNEFNVGGTLYDYLPLAQYTPKTIEITLNEPTNSSYTDGSIGYNATANDTAVEFCLSTDGNVTYSICDNDTSELVDSVIVSAGFYNWTFRVYNLDGYYDWETVYFTVVSSETPLHSTMNSLVTFLLSLVLLMSAVAFAVNEMMKEKPNVEVMVKVVLFILVMLIVTSAAYASSFTW